jgi:hypothetical protein
MDKNHEVEKDSQEVALKTITPEPFFKWKYTLNQETGKNEFDRLELSDGSDLDSQSLKRTLKRATGTSDLAAGEGILRKVAYGMTAEGHDTRLNEVSIFLPSLHPRDEAEAMLFGQFLALQDSGMKCLRLANLPGQGFYHEERLFNLANKLLNTANQTMQTVLKYRNGGQQTVQVVHVYNEGQAIVAQNLSPPMAREGDVEKIRELNPLDHCGSMRSKK